MVVSLSKYRSRTELVFELGDHSYGPFGIQLPPHPEAMWWDA